jgi:hypothetical protein
MSQGLWNVAVMIVALWLFFNLAILVRVCQLAKDVEDDRASVKKIRGDCERGVEAMEWLRLRVEGSVVKGAAGERFRRLMEEDEGPSGVRH